jgi:hypothetical protein
MVAVDIRPKFEIDADTLRQAPNVRAGLPASLVSRLLAAQARLAATAAAGRDDGACA